MREIDKYNVLKEKLQGICEENNLTYSIQNRKYPFFMTVKPLGGFDAQQTMIEGIEDAGDTGYISPEAVIVFAYKDGDLAYKMSETINISDTLFNKIKNLFKKMYSCYMAYFFRDVLETGGIPSCDAVTAEQEKQGDEVETTDTEDAFSDFMADAEPALEDEDTEE